MPTEIVEKYAPWIALSAGGGFLTGYGAWQHLNWSRVKSLGLTLSFPVATALASVIHAKSARSTLHDPSNPIRPHADDIEPDGGQNPTNETAFERLLDRQAEMAQARLSQNQEPPRDIQTAHNEASSKLDLLQRLIGQEARAKRWTLTAQGSEDVIVTKADDRSKSVRARWNNLDLCLCGIVNGRGASKISYLLKDRLNGSGYQQIVEEIQEIFDELPTT